MKWIHWALILPILSLAVRPALAHGVVIDLTFDSETGEITLAAAFDTGEIMDEAQVAVFAPSDIVNPWLTGSTNADGVFSFLPDYADEGEWSVQVRKAGHGGLVTTMIDASMAPLPDIDDDSTSGLASDTDAMTIEGGRIIITGDAVFEVQGEVVITTTGAASTPNATNTSLTDGFTPAQIIIMSVSVVWGAIGTAFYFTGRSKPNTKGVDADDAH